MNVNKLFDFSSSLFSYFNNIDDLGGLYFDQYMRVRGLDSFSFGQRYFRFFIFSRVQFINFLFIIVISGIVDGSDMKFICFVCGKSYLDKDFFSRYYEIYFYFSCNVCGKTYSTKLNLYIYMKKYSDDKIYFCNTCDKIFISLFVFKIYLRIYIGEKFFICLICGVVFVKNIYLKRYLFIYIGIKFYECKVCNKRFSRFDYLKRYVQSIYIQDRFYICLLCGKDFVRKYEFNKYMKQLYWGFIVGEEDQEMDFFVNEFMDISFMVSMYVVMAKGFVSFSELKGDIFLEDEENLSGKKGLVFFIDRILVIVKEEFIFFFKQGKICNLSYTNDWKQSLFLKKIVCYLYLIYLEMLFMFVCFF